MKGVGESSCAASGGLLAQSGAGVREGVGVSNSGTMGMWPNVSVLRLLLTLHGGIT